MESTEKGAEKGAGPDAGSPRGEPPDGVGQEEKRRNQKDGERMGRERQGEEEGTPCPGQKGTAPREWRGYPSSPAAHPPHMNWPPRRNWR